MRHVAGRCIAHNDQGMLCSSQLTSALTWGINYQNPEMDYFMLHLCAHWYVNEID
jgi:hypothetical protein